MGNIIHISSQVSIMFLMIFSVYSPEIIGNVFFFIVHSEPYSNEFMDPMTSIRLFWKYFTKTFTMMVGGGGDIGQFAENESIFLLFFVCLFLLRICIVVMNVLIGLTVSRIDTMMKKANLDRLEKTARACQSAIFLRSLIGKQDKEWTKIEFNLDHKPSCLNYIMIR